MDPRRRRCPEPPLTQRLFPLTVVGVAARSIGVLALLSMTTGCGAPESAEPNRPLSAAGAPGTDRDASSTTVGTDSEPPPTPPPTSATATSSSPAVAVDTTAPANASTSTSTSTSADPSQRRPFGANSQQFTYRDDSRGRLLLTTVYWPLPATTNQTLGEPPLVLIAHGLSLPGWGYELLARRIVGAGFVVAVVDFPGTSGVVGNGNRADIVNQPADLSFVADRVIAGDLPDGSRPPWPTVSPTAPIGVVGHSDGGLTATAFGYNRSYRDPRVGAVVSLTGGIALFGGSYFDGTGTGPALLAAHPTGDETNPFSASTNLVGSHRSGAPRSSRYLLTIQGGSHLGPFMFDSTDSNVSIVVALFLAATLRGDETARAWIDTTPVPGPSLLLSPG